MKNPKLLYLALVLIPSVACFSDFLELKNGQTMNGKYVGGTQNSVRFQVGDELKVLPVSELLALTFTGGGQPIAVTSPPVAAAPAAVATAASIPAPTVPATTGAVTIPAGTRLLVRMSESIDSKRDRPGKRFTSKLETDLRIGGKLVAARGSNVYGRLSQAKQAGRVRGQSELVLELTDILIKGQTTPIITESLGFKSDKSGKKTGRKLGLGAGIGALAGGSKGAKRGLAVGGAASVLTKGSSVNVPKGTLLEFRILQPLQVKP